MGRRRAVVRQKREGALSKAAVLDAFFTFLGVESQHAGDVVIVLDGDNVYSASRAEFLDKARSKTVPGDDYWSKCLETMGVSAATEAGTKRGFWLVYFVGPAFVRFAIGVNAADEVSCIIPVRRPSKTEKTA